MNPIAQKEVEHRNQMVGDALSICVLDDEPAMIGLLEEMVEGLGHTACGTSVPREALDLIGKRGCRVVLCDIKMPSMSGMTFLDMALRRDPGIYVILMTGYYTMEAAIDAIRRGAYDCIPKPVDRARLKRTLQDIQGVFQQRHRVEELDQQLLAALEFHGIIGRSPAMLDVFDLVRKIARHYTNVLLIGQTGTGKELVAHAIHQLSPAANHTFAVCNCSAMADTLLESQLFGHVRDAFTGSGDARPGLFEYANGGTIFLDEVGETSLSMQAKLLRVIQTREIQRVGDPAVRHVDVRLIAATNRDLRAEVVAGRFREDLFYRLSNIQIRVPSLTERFEDIPLLVNYFIKKYNALYERQIQCLTRRAQFVFLQHSWPGNVRELENVISGAALVAPNNFIDIEDLPENLQQPAHTSSSDPWRPLPLEEIRKEHIRRVLEMCGGNRVRTAQMLGIGRTSLYRYLKRSHKNGSQVGGPA